MQISEKGNLFRQQLVPYQYHLSERDSYFWPHTHFLAAPSGFFFCICSTQRMRICCVLYTMYSLCCNAMVLCFSGCPSKQLITGPYGILTPLGRVMVCLQPGPRCPQPFTEWQGGSSFSMYSAWLSSLDLPRTTSHISIRQLSWLPKPRAAQAKDLSYISAKQTPLPNMQPVAGASGGAILRPWLRMPMKLNIWEPWKRRQ
ncbi:hypothetical protein FGO68_gene4413 [Halteria grandinella]|uniref:Uncharacterized protein n=1 Tax=Halteria grandinella TaxID=5974 RepID=A0A8J8NBP3_HALGN|nr:hypothetical protein FGO68_gene4413 [Halteria grandinella]